MSLIVCKKCGGPHITLKCGKEPKPIETKQINKPINKSNYKDRNSDVYLDKKRLFLLKYQIYQRILQYMNWKN